MSATTDFERTLATWLEQDGPSDVPERVITAAFAEARTVRQRRARSILSWLSARVARKDEAAKSTRPIDLVPGRTAGGPLRLVWIVALIGLLAAAALGAAVVGSGLLRPSDRLSVVLPSPSATPSPTAATPLVTLSAFGPITWRSLDALDIPDTPDSVIGTPSGLVIVDGTGLRQLASDGSSSVIASVRDSGPGLTPASIAITTTKGYAPAFVVGEDLLVGGLDPFWFRRSGSTWVASEPIEFEGILEARPGEVAAGPQGIVVIDDVFGDATVYHSADGVHFVRAEQAPNTAKLIGRVAECDPGSTSWSATGWNLLRAVIATDDGFVAMSPAAPEDTHTEPICEPVLWFSADGSSWELVSPISPFGPGSYVTAVASRGGRHVAIGGDASLPAQPTVVWVSDDGVSWDQLPALPTCPRCGSWPSKVVAGEPGWVILSGDGDAWTSADGRAWQELIGWPRISAGGWRDQDLALAPGSVYAANPGFDDATVIGTFEP